MFLPDVYQSTATVLVECQQVPEEFVRSTVTSEIDIRLQSITRQIMSRSRLENLIERFGLYTKLRQQVPLEQVLERMRKDIHMDLQEAQQKSSRESATVAFAINYSGKNPQQVVQVTNALASFYIEENLKVREQQAAGTAEFLRVQLKETKTALEKQEQRLSQFREKYIGELPEQLQANLLTLALLNTQLRLNTDKQTRSREQRALLTKQLAGLDGYRVAVEPRVPAAVPAAPDPRVAQLEKLQQDLAVLRERYVERYPDVVQLKAEIEALEQHLAGTKSPDTRAAAEPSRPVTPSGVDAVVLDPKKEITSLDAELKGLHTEKRGLLRSIGLYQQRIENTPRTTVRFLDTTPTTILSPSTDPRMVDTLSGGARLGNVATYASC
jgi:uncharacterized protein involved in exopolysaccharide biosynthesis